MAPPLSCKCRRRGGCNERECRPPPQPRLPATQPTLLHCPVVVAESGRHPRHLIGEKRPRAENATSSACRERESTHSKHRERKCAAWPSEGDRCSASQSSWLRSSGAGIRTNQTSASDAGAI